MADPSSAEEFPGTALIFPASLRLVGEGMIPSPAPPSFTSQTDSAEKSDVFSLHHPLPHLLVILLCLPQMEYSCDSISTSIFLSETEARGKRSEPEQNIIFYKPTACSAWWTLIYSLTVTPPEEVTWRSADVRAQKKGEVLRETYSGSLKPEDIG